MNKCCEKWKNRDHDDVVLNHKSGGCIAMPVSSLNFCPECGSPLAGYCECKKDLNGMLPVYFEGDKARCMKCKKIIKSDWKPCATPKPIEELPNDSFRCEHPWDALFLKLNEVIRAINKLR